MKTVNKMVPLHEIGEDELSGLMDGSLTFAEVYPDADGPEIEVSHELPEDASLLHFLHVLYESIEHGGRTVTFTEDEVAMLEGFLTESRQANR